MAVIPTGQLKLTIANKNLRWQPKDSWLANLTEQQRKRLLGVVPNEPDRLARMAPQASVMAGAYDTQVDWRSRGGRNHVSPVKDQGGCGSCVSFCCVALVEAMASIERSQRLDLSEADLHFCSSHGASCGGWWPSDALNELRGRGTPDEASFPYASAFTTAGPRCLVQPDRDRRATKISEVQSLSSMADRKTWLTRVGPMSAVFEVFEDFYSYGSGVYAHASGNSEGLHCVLIVGYSETERCWICKNSWGTGWGDDGYFKIAYGQCGIDTDFPFWGLQGVKLPDYATTRLVPGWFGSENQGADIAIGNLGGGRDLVVFHIDNPGGENHGYYRVGRKLDASGRVTGGWGDLKPVPGWFGAQDQGAGIALPDLDGSGRPDLVVFHVDNPSGENHGYLRIGRDLDADGNVTGGWSNIKPVPGWFGAENQGAAIAIADLNGDGKPEIVVFHVDNPSGENHGYYRIGWSLDRDGNVAGWSDIKPVPGWFGAEDQGAGIAVADLTGAGRPDLVVFHVDNPSGDNHGYYRIGRDLDASGNVSGGWSEVKAVPGWFGWENQGAGIAVSDLNGDGRAELVIFHVDNPGGENHGYYRIGWSLDRNGDVQGSWF